MKGAKDAKEPMSSSTTGVSAVKDRIENVESPSVIISRKQI